MRFHMTVQFIHFVKGFTTNHAVQMYFHVDLKCIFVRALAITHFTKNWTMLSFHVPIQILDLLERVSTFRACVVFFHVCLQS